MTYVMSDIHGNLRKFRQMMQTIEFSENDELYILGDVIDRGKFGITILERIMNSDNIHMLIGNHEYMMLNAILTDDPDAQRDAEDLWTIWNGGEVTLEAYAERKPEQRDKIIEFLQSLPAEFEVTVNNRDFLLVHSSPLKWFEDLDEDDRVGAAVWERITIEDKAPEGKFMIFGHTPTSNYQGLPWRMWHHNNMIGIDCGCAYPKGKLGCLRLDDMKEFYV